MTTPGGVPNLPPGALTIDTLASETQDMTTSAMKSRAAGRFSSIFNTSTGLSPASDITPFGILTGLFSGFNSTVANADPADVQGPEDLPGLLIDFIEGLPVIGQFVELFEAILGTYTGDDATLLGIQALFAPIRAIADVITGLAGGSSTSFLTSWLNPSGGGSGIFGPILNLIPGLSNLSGFGGFLNGTASTASTANTNANTANGSLSSLLSGSGLGSFSSVGSAISNAASNFTSLFSGFGVGNIGGFVTNLLGTASQASTANTNATSVAGSFQSLLNVFKGGSGGVLGDATSLFQHLTPGTGVFNAAQLDNVENIPTLLPTRIGGVAGGTNIGADLRLVIDAAWSGLTKTAGTNKSTSELTNAATDIVNTTEAAQAAGDENSAILAIRDNKALYEGVNETEESTFLLDTLVGATDPPNFSVVAATNTLSFWRAGQSAHKGFVTCFIKLVGTVTGVFIDLYKMNDVGGTLKLQLVKSSGDLSGQATTTAWRNVIWIMNSIDRPDVNPGDTYAFALRMTGAGSVSIAGKAAGWMPDHALAASGTVPSRPGATRPTGVTDVTMSTITYSGNQAWFGFGIVTGDITPPPLIPRPTTYSAPGTYHYDLVSLKSAGFNYVDAIGVGSGGGGCGGFAGFQYGAGGGAGTWGDSTVNIAAAIAAGATEITVVVPSGGTAGAALVVAGSGAYGGPGTATTFTVTGIGSLSCAGGAAGIGGSSQGYPQAGQSPGNHTFNGITYTGGAQQNSNHGAGNGPGGGGAGDGGGFYFGNGGGVGGPGGAFLRAYQ